MAKEPIRALAPMLAALRIRQVVSLDECAALWSELHAVTSRMPPPFELSGNQWCALVNLAIARHGAPPTPQGPK